MGVKSTRKCFLYLQILCGLIFVFVFMGNLILMKVLVNPFLDQTKVEIKSDENLTFVDLPGVKKKDLVPWWYPPRMKLLNYTIINYENVGDTKHILFFTQFWYHHNWGLSNETVTKDSPELKDCPYKNCIFTNKRNYLKETHEYDAIIFHQTISSWYNKSLMVPIKTRSPHQLYIIATQEWDTQQDIIAAFKGCFSNMSH